MVSNVIAAVLNIVIMLAILAVSILSVIGAIDCHKSSLYISNSLVKNAHLYFTICAILGIVFVVILFVIAIIIIKRGKISSKHFNGRDIPGSIRNFNTHHKTSWVVIIIFILNILIFLTIGILCVLAALDLQNVPNKDEPLKSAYQWSIYAASTAVGGSILTLIILVLVFWIKHKNSEKAVKITEEHVRNHPTDMNEVRKQDSELAEKVESSPNTVNKLVDTGKRIVDTGTQIGNFFKQNDQN